MISILIATKDRPGHLNACIKSILKNTYKNFEIIVLDQSQKINLHNNLFYLKNSKINYKRLSVSGKSKALNLGIALSKGEIISFTDDDCIVDKNWLKNIFQFFKTNPTVEGCFGQTRPYKELLNNGLVCPAVFYNTDSIYFNANPYNLHYKCLGMGNNMILKRSLINTVGKFSEWLGPGTKIGTAEDVDYVYRAQQQKYVFYHNPSIIVYHNKWLSYLEEEILQSEYSTGIIAFLTYQLLNKGSMKLIAVIFQRVFNRTGSKIKKIIFHLTSRRERCIPLKEIYFFFLELYSANRGVLFGVLRALNFIK